MWREGLWTRLLESPLRAKMEDNPKSNPILAHGPDETTPLVQAADVLQSGERKRRKGALAGFVPLVR